MPIYAFRCPKCGHEYEELVQRVGQSVPCPECGHSKVERLLSAPAVGRSSKTASARSAPSCDFTSS
jgi:putative FmdB family regulatory protein